jgi:hypothetical protein
MCSSDGTTTYTPIADAGPNQQAKRGDVVTIDGGYSRDTTTPLPQPLTFAWSQVITDRSQQIVVPAGMGVINTALVDPVTGGPVHVIEAIPNTNPSNPSQLTFRIDKLANGQNIPDNTVLTFQLDVTNCPIWWLDGPCGRSSARMTVTVMKNPTPIDTLTAVTATWRTRRSRLDVAATTSDPTAVLTVLGFGDMGPALPIAPGVPAPPGSMAYTQVGVNPPPAEITVRSSSGAIVTVTVTLR